MLYSQLELYDYAQLEQYTYDMLENIIAIFDRVQADITNKTNKGYINYTDLNRLEENIKTVADLFNIPFTQETWIIYELPRQADYQRWKVAIDLIKSAYDVLQTSPNRPFNTYQKWNELEYLLFYTDKIFNENEQAKSYCGEFYCGEWGLI